MVQFSNIVVVVCCLILLETSSCVPVIKTSGTVPSLTQSIWASESLKCPKPFLIREFV